ALRRKQEDIQLGLFEPASPLSARADADGLNRLDAEGFYDGVDHGLPENERSDGHSHASYLRNARRGSPVESLSHPHSAPHAPAFVVARSNALATRRTTLRVRYALAASRITATLMRSIHMALTRSDPARSRAPPGIPRMRCPMRVRACTQTGTRP